MSQPPPHMPQDIPGGPPHFYYPNAHNVPRDNASEGMMFPPEYIPQQHQQHQQHQHQPPSQQTHSSSQKQNKPSSESSSQKLMQDASNASAGGEGDASTHGAVGGTTESSNIASSEGETTSGEEEEQSEYSDPVKLFVGQVPKTMEEPDLFPIFEQYGPMEDVVIIRDRHTGQHRGCAFVTYMGRESAETCVKELHNQYALEGGRRPLQVRPAGRKEVENKIFIGMLPHDVEEELVKELFSPFGDITGIFMIRTNEGLKKGCAFIKYTERASAIAAISNMHGQVTVEGSNRPLIVKFADTKNQKRTRMQLNRIESNYNPHHHHQPHMSSQASLPYFVPGPNPHVHHHVPYPGHATPPHSVSVSSITGEPQPTFSPPPPADQYSSYQTHPNLMFHPYGMASPDTTFLQERLPQQDAMNPRPREGPAGANLFIYHLPHDLTDADLATAFNPFGNVISAKVYVDRYTGESKGFGFVSYDSIISAELAIEQMNGFQIGSKRLKVQHKRVNHRPQPPLTGSYTGDVYTGDVSYGGELSSYYPEPMPPLPPQHILHGGVPPSIEISGERVDGPAPGGEQNSPDSEVETLTSNFDSLQT